MADDVLLNKVAIIERCLKRVEEGYRGHEQDLVTNFTRQDAIVLNLLRACETAIDLAMHLVRVKRLGCHRLRAGRGPCYLIDTSRLGPGGRRRRRTKRREERCGPTGVRHASAQRQAQAL